MDSSPQQLREAGLRRRLTELAAELLKTEEELNLLKALLNVNSKDDMIAWFKKHYSYFSFNIHLVTVNA